MTSTEGIAKKTNCQCPRCGSVDVRSMEELRELVSSKSSNFSDDMVEWLSPPKAPSLRVSSRHRIGLRNSAAFIGVTLIVFVVATFALTGGAPSPLFAAVALVVASLVGSRTWKAERARATKEDALLKEHHVERYQAYLNRREVWARLRHCPNCAGIVDMETRRIASLFEVHELVNTRRGGATVK